MKQHTKTAQPVSYSFEKLAKQRILDAAHEIFRLYGIRAGIGAIAFQAHSNVATVQKHFGYSERLVASNS
jgi:hypothetical protein